MPLKSWQGIMQQVTNYLLAQACKAAHLTYGAGVTVDRQTQLIQRDGEFYRVTNADDLPLALTGTWATDSLKLQAIGDALLRLTLANTADPMLGAAKVGRAIRHTNSLSELRALVRQYDGEVVYLRGRTSPSTPGQGLAVWIAGSALADNDGTVYGSSAAGRWIRPGTDRSVDAAWVGVGNDGADYSNELQAAINFAGLAAGGGQGMIVELPRGVVGLSKTINIPNRVGVCGANGRGSVLRALPGFVGSYLISATNGSSSMFASWIRDMCIDARGTNLTAVVYTTA